MELGMLFSVMYTEKSKSQPWEREEEGGRRAGGGGRGKRWIGERASNRTIVQK